MKLLAIVSGSSKGVYLDSGEKIENAKVVKRSVNGKRRFTEIIIETAEGDEKNAGIYKVGNNILPKVQRESGSAKGKSGKADSQSLKQ